MPVEPTGQTSIHLDRLKTMVAGSSAFQDWTGSTSTDTAKSHVYIEGFVPTASIGDHRPFVLIGINSRNEQREANSIYLSEASYQIAFEADVPAELANDFDQAGYDFSNRVDAVLEDIQDASATQLVLKSFTMQIAPTRSNPREGQVDDYFYCVWLVTVGL